MDFQQTDDSIPIGLIQACSAVALGQTPGGALCVLDGTLGETPITVTIAASSPASLVMFGMVPGVRRWKAGAHTMRLNVSTSNSNISWRRLYFCRVNAEGASLASIAQNLTVNQSVGTTGVKTAQATQESEILADKTDYLYAVLTFINMAGSEQSFAFIPDQIINTPFKVVAYRHDQDWPALPGMLDGPLGVCCV